MTDARLAAAHHDDGNPTVSVRVEWEPGDHARAWVALEAAVEDVRTQMRLLKLSPGGITGGPVMCRFEEWGDCPAGHRQVRIDGIVQHFIAADQGDQWREILACKWASAA